MINICKSIEASKIHLFYKSEENSHLTLLHLAAMKPDNEAIIEYLIEKDMSLGALDIKGKSVLHYAYENSTHTNTIACLKNSNTKLTLFPDKKNETIFDIDTRKNFAISKAIITQMVEDSNIDINNGESTLVHLFARYAPANLLEELVQEIEQSNKMDVKACVQKLDADGISPLQHAVCNNNSGDKIKLCESLLKHIDTEHINYSSQRVLYGRALKLCLSQHNSKDITELLLKHGADIHAVDYEGKTVLHYAIYSTPRETIKLLIEAGIKVDTKDNSGYTAYDMAEARKRTDLTTLLEPPKNLATDGYTITGLSGSRRLSSPRGE